MKATRKQLVKDLALVAEGDESAFVRVYQATSRKLYGIIVRILVRHDLSEEVLQESYIRVWNSAKNFDDTKSSPITWMATIARNRALDEARRKTASSIDDVPDLLEMPSEEDVLADHMDREELRRLQDCMNGLDRAPRDALQMVFFEGRTRQDVATQFGQPISKVRKWIQIGLGKLKKCLEP